MIRLHGSNCTGYEHETICLLSISSTLLTGGILPKPKFDSFQGIYVGADLGFGQALFKGIENTVFSQGLGNNLLISSRDSIYNNSAIAGVQVGYGWQWTYGYFGLYAQGDFYKFVAQCTQY